MYSYRFFDYWVNFADFLTPRLQKRCVFFRKVDRFAKASPSVKDIRRGDFYSLSRYGTKTLLKSHSKTRSFSLLKIMTELAQTVLVRLMFFVPLPAREFTKSPRCMSLSWRNLPSKLSNIWKITHNKLFEGVRIENPKFISLNRKIYMNICRVYHKL